MIFGFFPDFLAPFPGTSKRNINEPYLPGELITFVNDHRIIGLVIANYNDIVYVLY